MQWNQIFPLIILRFSKPEMAEIHKLASGFLFHQLALDSAMHLINQAIDIAECKNLVVVVLLAEARCSVIFFLVMKDPSGMT